MFFTDIKENYSNYLPLFNGASFYQWRTIQTMEKWLSVVLSPPGWQLIQQKTKQHQCSWVLFMCWGLAHQAWGRGRVSVIKRFQSWRCPSESQGTVYSCILVPLLKGGRVCFHAEMSRVMQRKHHEVGHRYIINTWKWLLTWAVFKCNFSSAISPQKGRDRKQQFNFKL